MEARSGDLISVRTELVREHLVGNLLAAARRRSTEPIPQAFVTAFKECSDTEATAVLARLGYCARIAETDAFEAARAPIPWLAAELADRERIGQWPRAAVELSRELAASEPARKPDPDSGAVSWRIPGPGGHVRHLVVAAALDSLRSDGLALSPVPGDAADARERTDAGVTEDLKRQWLFGFLLRCCEEASDRGQR